MAIRESEFLLPPEFLTADDFLAGFETKPNPDQRFPEEFPYDLCSSPADSTGTESDDCDDFLAELTLLFSRSSLNDSRNSALNQFQSRFLSGSGKSAGSSNGTRSSNGSSQVTSPTTPLSAKNDDAWDLLLQAAGEVARLKMRAGDGLIPAGRTFAPFPPVGNLRAGVSNVTVGAQMVKQQQGCGFWDNGGYIEPQLSQTRPTRPVFGGAGSFVDNGRFGRPAVGGGAGHAAALRPLHFQHQTPSARPAIPFGGSGVAGAGGFAIKRERSGTGVFLPRRYGNNNISHKPVDSAPKTGCYVPKAVHGSVPPNKQNGGFVSPNDMVNARNAAMVAQQRRNVGPEIRPELAINHEVCLPQEWTY